MQINTQSDVILPPHTTVSKILAFIIIQILHFKVILFPVPGKEMINQDDRFLVCRL